MQLSSKGRYAVMAMADLAHFGGKTSPVRPIPIAAIAERQNISQAFLEQIFMLLRRASLVESSRGPGGGYSLARDADDISIYEIMQAVEEPVQMTRCSLEEIGGCVDGSRCLTHGLWQDLSQHITQFLAETSLQDVSVTPALADQVFEASADREVQP